MKDLARIFFISGDFYRKNINCKKSEQTIQEMQIMVPASILVQLPLMVHAVALVDLPNGHSS